MLDETILDLLFFRQDGDSPPDSPSQYDIDDTAVDSIPQQDYFKPSAYDLHDDAIGDLYQDDVYDLTQPSLLPQISGLDWQEWHALVFTAILITTVLTLSLVYICHRMGVLTMSYLFKSGLTQHQNSCAHGRAVPRPSQDMFQTPYHSNRSQSPTQLAVALLRQQLVTAQNLMSIKRRLVEAQPWHATTTNTHDNDFSNLSTYRSEADQAWSMANGAGVRLTLGGDRARLGLPRYPSQSDVGTSKHNGRRHDQFHVSRGRGSTEYLSPDPPQLVSDLSAANSENQSVNVPELSQWPMWATPFTSASIKRMLGMDDGTTTAVTENRRTNTRGTTTTLRALKGSSAWSNGAGGIVASRPTGLSQFSDKSILSLEIATKDLLQGDLSKIRVKYNSETSLTGKEKTHTNEEKVNHLRGTTSQMSTTARRPTSNTAVQITPSALKEARIQTPKLKTPTPFKMKSKPPSCDRNKKRVENRHSQTLEHCSKYTEQLNGTPKKNVPPNENLSKYRDCASGEDSLKPAINSNQFSKCLHKTHDGTKPHDSLSYNLPTATELDFHSNQSDTVLNQQGEPVFKNENDKKGVGLLSKPDYETDGVEGPKNLTKKTEKRGSQNKWTPETSLNKIRQMRRANANSKDEKSFEFPKRGIDDIDRESPHLRDTYEQNKTKLTNRGNINTKLRPKEGELKQSHRNKMSPKHSADNVQTDRTSKQNQEKHHNKFHRAPNSTIDDTYDTEGCTENRPSVGVGTSNSDISHVAEKEQSISDDFAEENDSNLADDLSEAGSPFNDANSTKVNVADLDGDQSCFSDNNLSDGEMSENEHDLDDVNFEDYRKVIKDYLSHKSKGFFEQIKTKECVQGFSDKPENQNGTRLGESSSFIANSAVLFDLSQTRSGKKILNKLLRLEKTRDQTTPLASPVASRPNSEKSEVVDNDATCFERSELGKYNANKLMNPKVSTEVSCEHRKTHPGSRERIKSLRTRDQTTPPEFQSKDSLPAVGSLERRGTFGSTRIPQKLIGGLPLAYKPPSPNVTPNSRRKLSPRTAEQKNHVRFQRNPSTSVFKRSNNAQKAEHKLMKTACDEQIIKCVEDIEPELSPKRKLGQTSKPKQIEKGKVDVELSSRSHSNTSESSDDEDDASDIRHNIRMAESLTSVLGPFGESQSGDEGLFSEKVEGMEVLQTLTKDDSNQGKAESGNSDCSPDATRHIDFTTEKHPEDIKSVSLRTQPSPQESSEYLASKFDGIDSSELDELLNLQRKSNACTRTRKNSPEKSDSPGHERDVSGSATSGPPLEIKSPISLSSFGSALAAQQILNEIGLSSAKLLRENMIPGQEFKKKAQRRCHWQDKRNPKLVGFSNSKFASPSHNQEGLHVPHSNTIPNCETKDAKTTSMFNKKSTKICLSETLDTFEDASKLTQKVTENRKTVPNITGPKRSLCSPRQCRLHGSDVSYCLCENRPVHQTITHQQYTMEELRHAGYSFFSDETKAGHKTGIRQATNQIKSYESGWSEKSNRSPLKKPVVKSVPMKQNAQNLVKTIGECEKGSNFENPDRLQSLEQTAKTTAEGFYVDSTEIINNTSKFHQNKTEEMESINQQHNVVSCFNGKEDAKLGKQTDSVEAHPTKQVEDSIPPKAMSKREMILQIKEKIGIARPTHANKTAKSQERASRWGGTINPAADKTKETSLKQNRMAMARKRSFGQITHVHGGDSSRDAKGSVPSKDDKDDGVEERKCSPNFSIKRFHFGKLKTSMSTENEKLAKSPEKSNNPALPSDPEIAERHDEEVKETLSPKSIDQPTISVSNTVGFRRRNDRRYNAARSLARGVSKSHSTLSERQNSKQSVVAAHDKLPIRSESRQVTEKAQNDGSKQGSHTLRYGIDDKHIIEENKPKTVIVASESNVRNQSQNQELKTESFHRNQPKKATLNEVGVVEEPEESINLNGGEQLMPISESQLKMSTDSHDHDETKEDALMTNDTKESVKPKGSKTSAPRLHSLTRSKLRRAEKAMTVSQSASEPVNRSRDKDVKTKTGLTTTLSSQGRVKIEEQKKEEPGLQNLSNANTLVQNDRETNVKPSSASSLNGAGVPNSKTLQCKSKQTSDKTHDNSQNTNTKKTQEGTTKLRDQRPRTNLKVSPIQNRKHTSVDKKVNSSPDRKHKGLTQNGKGPPLAKQYISGNPSVASALESCSRKLNNLTPSELHNQRTTLEVTRDANMVLTCTEIDCQDITPYRKTKLAWGISPEKTTTTSSQITPGCNGETTTNTSFSVAGAMSLTRSSSTATRTTVKEVNVNVGKNAPITRKQIDGHFTLYKDDDFKQNESLKTVHVYTNDDQEASQEISKCERNITEGEHSLTFPYLAEITSEEAEKFKFPDSLPKMIGSTDTSDPSISCSRDVDCLEKSISLWSDSVRVKGRYSRDIGIIRNNEESNGDSVINESTVVDNNKDRDTKELITASKKTLVKPKPLGRIDDGPSAICRDMVRNLSPFSIGDISNQTDASLGEFETPDEASSSKLGLNDLIRNAERKKLVITGERGDRSRIRRTKLKHPLRPAQLVETDTKRQSQFTVQAKHPDKNCKNEQFLTQRVVNPAYVGKKDADGVVCRNVKHNNEVQKNLEAADDTLRTSGDIGSFNLGTESELKTDKDSQSQSDSKSKSRSRSRSQNTPRDEVDSATNTLERLVRKRLVSGRSHERFGGSNSAKVTSAASPIRQPSSVYKDCDDFTDSPNKHGTSNMLPEDISTNKLGFSISKFGERSRLLPSKLPNEGHGYVTSAAHHFHK